MGIEVNGVKKRVTAEDGEISVKAGSVHNFFIHDDSPEDMTVILSASDSGIDFQLDRIFFENWYGYWHDALLHDGGLDWIQFLAVSVSNPAFTAVFLSFALIVLDCNADPRWRRRLHTSSEMGPVPTPSGILDLCRNRSVDRGNPGI